MATKTKPVTKALQYFVSESVAQDVIQTEFDFKSVTDTAMVLADSEKSLIMKLFANIPTPTFADYQAWRKDNKLSHVTSKTIGFENLFDTLNDCRIISEQQSAGFDVLAYWNGIGKTAKRARQPSISNLKKGALKFKNGSNDDVPPEEKAEKYAVTFYNSIQNCKGKKWQLANDKMVAIMTGLGIAIPESKTETE